MKTETILWVVESALCLSTRVSSLLIVREGVACALLTQELKAELGNVTNVKCVLIAF